MPRSVCMPGQALIDAYHAMDVFAFASHSETQGMVVAEAMAAGLPVVAVSAPGIREVVVDGGNGCLLDGNDAEAMADALVSLREPRRRLPLCESALATAAAYVRTEVNQHGPAWWSGNSEESTTSSPGRDDSEVDVSSSR